MSGLRSADRNKQGLGRGIVTIRFLYYLWHRAGKSKAMASTRFHVTVIICAFDHSGFSLLECTVSVARILTFSFTLIQEQSEGKLLESLVCWRSMFLIFFF